MSSHAIILVVEDHHTTRSFLADNLTADGYDVIEAEGSANARELLHGAFPDLAIVDLGLPDGDGLDLLTEVRTADRIAGRVDPDLPLLVLSGRTSEVDRLRGFDRGADGYLSKPFSYYELSAQVRALLRRTRHRPATGRIRVGTLELDQLSRQVWVKGERVALSNKEFALLRALAGEPTRVLTKINFGPSREQGTQAEQGITTEAALPCLGDYSPHRSRLVVSFRRGVELTRGDPPRGRSGSWLR